MPLDIDILINGVEQFDRHVCNDARLDKAVKLIAAAAKITYDAASLLRSYSCDNLDPRARRYAELASQVVEEASTLTAAARSICVECERHKTY